MTKRTICWVTACGLLLLSTAAATCSAGDAAQEAAGSEGNAKDIFGAIAEGYRANRESFTEFSCRFKWRNGKARSLEDARNGKLEQVLEHDGLWIVDGLRTRYQFVCSSVNLSQEFDRAVVARRKTPGITREISLPGQEYFYLKNGTMRAHQSKIIKSLNLIPLETEDPAGIQVTPFALGLMGGDEVLGPSAILKGVVDGHFIGRFDGTVEEAGKPLLAVSRGYKGEGLRTSYRFDPERGYLVVHFWDSDPHSGKRNYEAFMVEAKDCGSGRWFPMRSIVVPGEENEPWPRRVKEMRVTELTLGRPADQDFVLDVPAGTQVTIVHTSNSVNIEHDTRVHESELESLAQRAIEHRALLGERRKARLAGESLSAPQGWSTRSLVTINIVLITALFGVFIVRRALKSKLGQ
jgi:hypothetical protein